MTTHALRNAAPIPADMADRFRRKYWELRSGAATDHEGLRGGGIAGIIVRPLRYQTVIVPLDGARYAEHALPLAAGIADACKIPLILESADALFGASYDRLFSFEETASPQRRHRMHAYLNDTADRLGSGAIEMATRLRPAPVPLCELPDVAGRSDVVVVARRARRFADPFRLGSSIERLLKYGAAPVIVARGYRWMCRRDALPMKHVLVVLDGAAEAERALPAALAIAEATEGELTLLRVVPGQPYYGTPSIESEFAAHAYLERVARSLESRQLLVAPAVRSSNEELGEVILSFAQDHNVDLIAMATSLRRSLVGKIRRRPARYLVRHGTIPVLLTNADSAASGVDALARHAAT